MAFRSQLSIAKQNLKSQSQLLTPCQIPIASRRILLKHVRPKSATGGCYLPGLARMPYFSYLKLTFKWIKVVWCSRICTLISMSGSRAPQTPPSCFGVWRDGIRVRDSPRSFESEPELGTVWERRRQRLKKWLAIRQEQRKRHCQRGGHSGNVVRCGSK